MDKPKTRRKKCSSLAPFEQRDIDLFEAYEKVIQKHGKYARSMPRTTLLMETVESPAPQFYISIETARIVIERMTKKRER